jgi:hypothetical protein
MLSTYPANLILVRRELYLTTHKTHKTDIHAPGGIRTRNPSKRAAADQRRRRRSNWDYHAVDTDIYKSGTQITE